MYLYIYIYTYTHNRNNNTYRNDNIYLFVLNWVPQDPMVYCLYSHWTLPFWSSWAIQPSSQPRYVKWLRASKNPIFHQHAPPEPDEVPEPEPPSPGPQEGPRGAPGGPQDDGSSVHGRFLWHYKSWRIDFDCHVLIHLDLFWWAKALDRSCVPKLDRISMS